MFSIQFPFDNDDDFFFDDESTWDCSCEDESLDGSSSNEDEDSGSINDDSSCDENSSQLASIFLSRIN